MNDSITKTLKAMQDMIAKQNRSIDSLNESITDLDAKMNEHLAAMEKNKKNEIVVPKFVKKKIYQDYGSKDVSEQWDLVQELDSEVNMNITSQIVSDVYDSFKGKVDIELIQMGVTTYSHSLKREHDEKLLNPGKFKEDRLKKKYRQRRQRMYNGRTKYVKEREEAIWERVGVNDMTDEEDGGVGGAFKTKSPKDRDPEITALIRKLDERAAAVRQTPTLKVKRVVSDSPAKHRR